MRWTAVAMVAPAVSSAFFAEAASAKAWTETKSRELSVRAWAVFIERRPYTLQSSTVIQKTAPLDGWGLSLLHQTSSYPLCLAPLSTSGASVPTVAPDDDDRDAIPRDSEDRRRRLR